MSILAGRAGGCVLEMPVPVAASLPVETLHHKLEEQLSDPQSQVYTAGKRFIYLMAGRRFGKTFLALTRLITWAMDQPGGLFYYVTATYRMAKQIAWEELKKIVPANAFSRKNEGELWVELANGSRICLKGAEDPDKLRGVSLSGCVIDEAAYVREDAWTMVLRPALSDQQGPAWFISTPAGENWFSDALADAETGEEPDGAGFRFTTLEGGRVAESEIEAARRTLGDELFEQEYLAKVVNLGELAIFYRQWFRYYEAGGELPGFNRILASVDATFKDGKSTDFVAITVWGQCADGMYLLDLVNRRMGFTETVETVKSLALRWQWQELLVEDKANGPAVIDTLKQGALGFSIREVQPLGGKVARANACTLQFRDGRVWFPSVAPWLAKFEQQLISFGVRKDGHDDMVDSTTQALNYIAGTGPMRVSTVSWGHSAGLYATPDPDEEDF
jgi:predicted phage terminase large subunit-like protein